MVATDYKLYTTLTKTRDENSLEQLPKEFQRKYNKTFLFDFSLLNDLLISDEIKKEIKLQSLKFVNFVNKFEYITKPCDIFTSFDYYSGIVYFKPFSVYSNSKNKREYAIFKLVKIENFRVLERNSIYDEFNTVEEYNYKIASENHTEYIEID